MRSSRLHLCPTSFASASRGTGSREAKIAASTRPIHSRHRAPSGISARSGSNSGSCSRFFGRPMIAPRIPFLTRFLRAKTLQSIEPKIRHGQRVRARRQARPADRTDDGWRDPTALPLSPRVAGEIASSPSKSSTTRPAPFARNFGAAANSACDRRDSSPAKAKASRAAIA